MPAIKTENLISAQAFGALLSLFLFFLIGGCGGGTMGTQTGEQRVAVVGTYLDARAKPVPGVEVTILIAGEPVAMTVTDSQGDFLIPNAVGINVSFVVRFESKERVTAVAVTASPNTTVIAVNLQENSDPAKDPIVVVEQAVATPTAIATVDIGATPTPTLGSSPTASPTPSPAPTSVASPTTTPIATPTTGVCTSGCDAEGTPTPTPASDAVECPDSSAIMSDGANCCAKENAGKSCCAPAYEEAGLCTCSNGSC